MRSKLAQVIGWLVKIPYSILAGLFIASLTVSIMALRANNQHMIQLRSAVYEADKSGVGIEPALDNLRSYVYSHMNTSLASGGNAIKPPIQLQYTYERLKAAEEAKVQTANSKIYTEAQEYCQAQIPAGTSGRGRVPCVQDYVTSHGVKVKEVPAGLYQFDFLSPTWSPDLAGWSLITSLLLLIWFVANLARQKLTVSPKT